MESRSIEHLPVVFLAVSGLTLSLHSRWTQSDSVAVRERDEKD